MESSVSASWWARRVKKIRREGVIRYHKREEVCSSSGHLGYLNFILKAWFIQIRQHLVKLDKKLKLSRLISRTRGPSIDSGVQRTVIGEKQANIYLQQVGDKSLLKMDKSNVSNKIIRIWWRLPRILGNIKIIYASCGRYCYHLRCKYRFYRYTASSRAGRFPETAFTR